MSTVPMFPASGLTRLRDSARKFTNRVPLRIKLITAVLALVVVALSVISFASVSFLSSYLMAQADATLQSDRSWAKYAMLRYEAGDLQINQPTATSLAWLPGGGQLQHVIEPIASPVVSGPASKIRSENGGLPLFRTEPGPDLSSGVISRLAADPEQPVTVYAASGGGHWRVVAYSYMTPGFAPGGPTPGIVIVGLDVSYVYQTITRLTNIDVVVSGVVIIVLAMIGAAVVRANLRPLDKIEETAGQIAAGHLDRRVPDRDPRTEVGSLGRSINAMLTQIEMGYRARQESEAAARQSEERMRQFIADASHELRTPLTALRGFAEYYRQRRGTMGTAGTRGIAAPSGRDGGTRGQEAAPGGAMAPGGTAAGSTGRRGDPAGLGGLTLDDLDRIMHRVEDEASRMGVLVEDLLLLARLDQQRPLERQPVDMLVLAADAVQDARMIAPERPVHLDVERGAAFLVEGDEVRLRQVVGNLMSNALKYTPETSPIDVRVGSAVLGPGMPAGLVPAPGASVPSAPIPAGHAGRTGPAGSLAAVFLEVADQGAGLTPEQAQRVFERFYRADKARARKTGGTGLGLAIVHALVTAHGGIATVRSEAGHGATFRVTLPLAANARNEDEEPGTESTEGLDGEQGQAAGRYQAADTGTDHLRADILRW